jgi:hypothetical protein
MVERKKSGAVEMRRPMPKRADSMQVGPAGVTIVITQAFCPNGHNLVRENDALFDGYPGIALYVEFPEWSGEVTLSPIHGDHSRFGIPRTVPDGSRCEIRCPECEVALPTLKGCGCDEGGELRGLYLRKDLSEGDVVGICNVLGCYRSRILDKFELLSEFVEDEVDL